jgi:hypothetical protein
MRPLLVLAVLAAMAQLSGCDSKGSVFYDPCAGKACGDRCTLCAPDATDCVETADLKGCTAEGACVSVGLWCPTGPSSCIPVPVCGANMPCSGKKCGDTCHLCPPNDPTCVEDAVVKACAMDGTCVPSGTYCPTAPGGSCFAVPYCG